MGNLRPTSKSITAAILGRTCVGHARMMVKDFIDVKHYYYWQKRQEREKREKREKVEA